MVLFEYPEKKTFVIFYRTCAFTKMTFNVKAPNPLTSNSEKEG